MDQYDKLSPENQRRDAALRRLDEAIEQANKQCGEGYGLAQHLEWVTQLRELLKEKRRLLVDRENFS